MHLRQSVKTAVRGLKTNRSRSFLTLLGIVIGISAVILLMSIGQGAQDLILKQIQGLGSRTIVVVPGREPSGPSDFAQVFSDSLKEKDLEILKRKENAPTITRIMPLVFGGDNAAYGSETFRLTIFGATGLISDIFDLYPQTGAMFGDDETRSRSDVVVIGAKVKEELFGDSDALGEKLKIKGRNLKVIGVLPKKGQVSFFNFDEAALMPYTTAQQYIFGIKYFHRFIIEADSEANIPRTVRDVEIALRNSHDLSGSDKDDFFVETQADLVGRISAVTDILTLLLVSIAAISLIVGGIGIMNIMLVSVTERTREIGLRKSLGATNKNILTQFLLEAVLLTVIGGILGVVLGAVLSLVTAVALSQFAGLDWTFSFPFSAALLGLLVSAIIGLVFGIYPARRAASLNPIEALRYE